MLSYLLLQNVILKIVIENLTGKMSLEKYY